MKTIKRLKRKLRKSLRRWLGISSNLDTMVGLIITDGEARVKRLEDNYIKVHQVDSNIKLLEDKIESQVVTKLGLFEDKFKWMMEADGYLDETYVRLYDIKDIHNRLRKIENSNQPFDAIKKSVEAIDVLADKLNTVFKATEVLQEEAIDNKRRLDRLEETISAIIKTKHLKIDVLDVIAKDMYEEQAAARGDLNED